MNAEKRKALRSRIQSYPGMGLLRRAMFNTANKLPDMLPADEKTLAQRETLTRRFLGGKMPKRIVLLHRGHYVVRSCVGGIVFTAAVFPSLGGRENHKLAAPMSRLSDAIAYHFRASRMRAGEAYNYSFEQAKLDADIMHVELEALSKLLVECGVPVAGHTAGHSVLAENNDHALSRVVVLEAQIKTHEARIAALETILRCSGTQTVEADSGTVAYPNVSGIPSAF